MAHPIDDFLFGFRPAQWFWKPALHRYLTGSWSRPRLRPGTARISGNLRHLGLYFHIPFCRRPCAFCPYNRVRYEASLYHQFEMAAHQEIDLVAQLLQDARQRDSGIDPRIGSLYVGGGTPTLQPESLARLILHIREALGQPSDVCVELHPSAMDDDCLSILKRSGVTLVSVGVQSLSDRLLRQIGRSHDAITALQSLRRAVACGFDTVNADLMFCLPTQEPEELDQDIRQVLELGVDQISCYPIFGFPYSELGKRMGYDKIDRPSGFRIRTMLDLIRQRSQDHGFVQRSVWSFARPQNQKFSSTTRHHYLGIGPSAASMIPGQFHVNTFSIQDYIKVLPHQSPVALVMPIHRQFEMAYWLYWRVYEMAIPRDSFRDLFDTELESVYGTFLKYLTKFGILDQQDGCYRVTEQSAYWIHRLQNEYALNYINRLWGQCRQTAWPREVVL
ncbi:MAG: radical SAM protein [Pirellulales bacterium]|nr:radical SAM protein [Pirellulales bacterium]